MSEMLTVGPRLDLDGPLPIERDYTLVKTVPVVTSESERWLNAADTWDYPTDAPSVWGPCVEGSESKPEPEEQPGNTTFQSFAALFPVFCTNYAGAYEELLGRARAVFERVESHAVERAFLGGIGIPLSPFLSDADTTVLNSGTGVSPTQALALIEDAIGAKGRGGVLHTTPKGATYLAADDLVSRTTGNGAALTTMLGTRVAVGTGYQGFAPQGAGGSAAGADEAWLFGSGPVQVRRSGVYEPGGGIAQVLDRAINDVLMWVERNYLVSWDTSIRYAVRMSLTP